MLAQKRLVEELIHFALTGVPPPTTGVVRDGPRGLPLLHFSYNSRTPGWMADGYRAQGIANQMLRAAKVNPDVLEGLVNAAKLRFTLFSPIRQRISKKTRPEGGPSMMVPFVGSLCDYPAAVMAIALCTPTGGGDTLADRISQCAGCAAYFVSKTRRPSRFCGDDCRNYDKTKWRSA